ncbi:hypothetical protein M3Y99_01578400 [Aphelenchoides fujianensis]|nr:hypothetical protein M3Y99_01578400 [Aphelenchoides fujianensis]
MRTPRMGGPILLAGLLFATFLLILFFNRRPAAFPRLPIADWERGFQAENERDGKRQDYEGNGTFILNPVESLLGVSCRRNTAPLVQRMRETQREINRVFQKTVTSAKDRYEMLPDFFQPAMNGFRYVLRPFNRFIHAAVSDVGGQQQALIKDVKTGGEGTFMNRKTFPHRSFAELLMNENEGRTVDFMTIDIEGAEFTLFRVLHQKRAELPVICQWNVEIHYAEERYGVKWTEFDRTLNEMLEEAYWVLLNVDQRTWKYRRLFFFNVGAEECVTKFLC